MNGLKIHIILLFITKIISFANANHNTSISYDNTLMRNKRAFEDVKVTNGPFGAAALKTTLSVAFYLAMCADNYLQPEVKEEKLCLINIKVLRVEHALIIDPKDHSKFLYPDDKGYIYFKEGDSVFLSCTDKEETNYFDLLPGKSYGTFSCVCGLTFSDDNRRFNFNELTCNNFPKYSHKLVEDNGSYYRKFEVGFYTRANEFLPLYELKYRKFDKIPEYVKYTVSKSLLGGQDTNVKVPLPPGICCRIIPRIHQALNEDAQMESFRELIFCQRHEPEKCYFKKDGCHIFGRDRLASKEANVYSAAALGTYHFRNIVPIFKCIANSNWLRIDKHINEMAITLKKDLRVYAGVREILVLYEPLSHLYKEMYLSVTHRTSGQGIKNFPIPLYLFKMVVDELERKGVVYVTVNNLFITDESATSYHICKNPIFEMTGMKMPSGWEPKNYAAGYSYMCTVNDFQTYNDLYFDSGIKDELLHIPAEEDGRTERYWVIDDELKKFRNDVNFGVD